MPGKRQHHFWQHLQRGFSVEEFGDHHIWVYRKKGEPSRTITRLHGQEKFFYGPKNSLADINLSNVESLLARFIADARNASDGTLLDPQLAGKLIASLEVRSAFLRAEFSNLVERLIGQLRVRLREPRTMSKAIQALLKKEPEILVPELEKIGAGSDLREVLTLLLHDNMPDIVNANKELHRNVLDQTFEPILVRLAEIVRESHIRSLEKDILNTERAQWHQKLSFRVVSFPDGDLILPDTAIALFTRNGPRPFSQKEYHVEFAVIPINSSTAIVASRNQDIARPLTVLNSALASCSFESFVARTNHVPFQSLTRKIGTNAKILSEAEVSKIVRTLDFF